MNTEEIIRIIDREIKQLWKTDIEQDYANCMLLKEDSLKNAFYHHLRTRLTDDFLIKNQIVLFDIKILFKYGIFSEKGT